MLEGAALRWVLANCGEPRLAVDVEKVLKKAATAGVNCWIAIGGRMTRQGEPYLLHSFAGEMFILQLTARQASGFGVEPNGLRTHLFSTPQNYASVPSSAISLEGLELKQTALTQADPIVARLRYSVAGEYTAPYCVRLDHEFSGGRRAAWAYPLQTLWGNGTLEVIFEPMARMPGEAVPLKGPVAVFARLFSFVQAGPSETRTPISTASAALMEVL